MPNDISSFYKLLCVKPRVSVSLFINAICLELYIFTIIFSDVKLAQRIQTMLRRLEATSEILSNKTKEKTIRTKDLVQRPCGGWTNHGFTSSSIVNNHNY